MFWFSLTPIKLKEIFLVSESTQSASSYFKCGTQALINFCPARVILRRAECESDKNKADSIIFDCSHFLGIGL